jgi:hypothetical protein
MNTAKIYLIENCYGDPNKVYIGKTKNNNRELAHSKKFGKNIIFTYIDEVESLDSKDWKPLECFWIEYFRQLGFDLQNKNKGGGGTSFHTEEAKNKYKIWRKDKKPTLGIKQSQETIDKKKKALTGKPKPDGFGDMMREVRLGVKKPQGTGDKISKSLKGRKNTWNSKTVLQYDLEGNFIKEWDNAAEAGLMTGTNSSTISKVCRGIFKKTNGFIWKFKNI